VKSKERDEAEINVKLKKKELSECKAVEAKAKSHNTSESKHACANHIESTILKHHKITKSCYHGGDLEGNDIRRLMAKGTVVFEETRRYLVANKPDSIEEQEISLHCNNFARLSILLESTLSTSHCERGDVTSDKINTLKTDLNLLRIKWKAQHVLLLLFSVLTFLFYSNMYAGDES